METVKIPVGIRSLGEGGRNRQSTADVLGQ